MKQKEQKNHHRTPMKTKSRIKKLEFKQLWIFGLGLLVILFLVYSGVRFYMVYQSNFHRMEKLGRELTDLRSAMNIDSVRQYKLQKIMRIVESHNSNMTSTEVYDIASEIYEMSIKYTNLNIDLLCAVVTHESALTWDPKIVSDAGAMGLMQIMPVTGLFLAEYEGIPWTTPEDVCFNPIYNIRMGSRYLSALMEQYGLEGGLAAYNGGEKQASLWLKNGKDDQYLWSETRTYIPAVQKLHDTYMEQSL